MERQSSEDLQRLRATRDSLVLAPPHEQREKFLTRLQTLQSQLEAGSPPQSLQETLIHMEASVSKGDRKSAKRDVALLAAQHWEQHEDWILGLRMLLSRH